MSTRISESDVNNEIDTTASSEAIQRAISAANALTDDVDAAGSVSGGRLEDIEMYLTLHFMAATDQLRDSDTIGDTKVEYQGETGQNLSATDFGQRAIDLDPTGFLEKKDKDKPEFHLENLSV